MALDQLQTEVEHRMEAGTPFSVVEDWINALDLDPLVATGLWLLALSYVPILRQRREARTLLAALASGQVAARLS